MSGMSYSDNKTEAFQAIVSGVADDDSNRGMTHDVAFTNAATDSLVLEEGTSMIELFATKDCWILLKPEASTTLAAVPANMVKTKCKKVASDITYFMGIPAVEGVRFKLSIIRSAEDGVLTITEGR